MRPRREASSFLMERTWFTRIIKRTGGMFKNADHRELLGNKAHETTAAVMLWKAPVLERIGAYGNNESSHSFYFFLYIKTMTVIKLGQLVLALCFDWRHSKVTANYVALFLKAFYWSTVVRMHVVSLDEPLRITAEAFEAVAKIYIYIYIL